MANKKNIRKWVAALRSGKYRQTRGKLHGKFGHCCLGVAELIGPLKGGGNSISYLNDRTQEWLGLEQANPTLKTKSGRDTNAACMNDKSHSGFNEIADAIERTYLQ